MAGGGGVTFARASALNIADYEGRLTWWGPNCSVPMPTKRICIGQSSWWWASGVFLASSTRGIGTLSTVKRSHLLHHPPQPIRPLSGHACHREGKIVHVAEGIMLWMSCMGMWPP